jgi:Chemoreceptor zinc-binding domain
LANQTLATEIDKALAAHAAWRRKLTTAIRTGVFDASPHDIACDDKCEFGQWLYGSSLDGAAKARKPYQVTRRLHAEFHDVAGRVARLAKDGKRGEAFSLLDNEYTARSETLSRALTKWRGEVEPGV